MKRILYVLALVCMGKALFAQTPYIYTIKADSVKIINTCDTAELIIKNHTQNVQMFCSTCAGEERSSEDPC